MHTLTPPYPIISTARKNESEIKYGNDLLDVTLFYDKSFLSIITRE